MSRPMLDRHAHLAARIFDTPLAIEPRKLQVILQTSAIADRFDIESVELETAQAGGPLMERARGEKPDEPYQVQDGVAVIDVMGALVHRGSWMSAMSGLASYDAISTTLAAALADRSVQAIVLRIDSPGGEVAGMMELADQIFEARSIKPICAVAEDMACSAAYLLGSAASKLYTAQAGVVGSVGIVTAHADTSERDKGRGVKITHFHAGARKIDGVKPLDDQSRAAIQGHVDALYGVMTAAVSKFRGIPQDAVKATEAGVYVGADAVVVGLADDVMSLPRAIASMSKRTPVFQVPAVPAAAKPALPAASGPTKETPMPPIETPTTVDPRDNELAELRAKNQVHEISAAREKKAKRDAVLEKHAKRLSPATLAAMQTSLEPIADADKVDEILARLPDETASKPQGTAGPAASPVATASGKDDPEGELIAKARAIRKENPQMNVQAAMIRILHDDPDLNARVTAQRGSYELPTTPPPAPRPSR